MKMALMNFVVHDTPESMALYIDSFDIRDNDILFYAVVYDHEHQLYSNKNYNQVLDQVELLDNVANGLQLIVHALDSLIKMYLKIKIFKHNQKKTMRISEITCGDEMDRCSSSDLTRIDGT